MTKLTKLTKVDVLFYISFIEKWFGVIQLLESEQQ